jgi:membrane protein implicated in regulation of membrane protease activity
MTSTGFSWSDFYLICFAVGFCFSFFSFVLGGSRFGRLHLPHFHGHGVPHLPAVHGPMGHAPAAGGHAAAAGHGPAAAHAQGAHQASRGTVSPFNFVTLTAFLAWFGGTGYLLTRFSSVWVGLGLLFSVLSGLVGGGIIFLFLSKVLMSDEENMDPADYEMVGVLGKVTSSIREGGTGELIYSQVGTRHVCGARSEDGSAIAKGTEVVVERYEKGIAYVRLWSEISGEDETTAGSATPGNSIER